MTDNVTFVFFLSGLNETKNHRFAIFSVTLLYYCLILLVNICIIVTIIMDKNLHEPMYILLCAFFLNGLYGSIGFYPKLLWDLLSPIHVISYAGCFIQALVINSFSCIDISLLAVMAYDRYLAICRPLQYHAIMSMQKLFKILCFSWTTPFCIMAVKTFITSRLKLCGQYIRRLFCSNGIIVTLACFSAEILINNIIGYILTMFFFLNVLFIVWSYMHLIKTCVNSIENRTKFMQTCVPHMTSFVIFLVMILFDVMNMRFGLNNFPQNLQNFLAIEFLIIPPMINPIIYGFKLTKIRNTILGFVYIKIK